MNFFRLLLASSFLLAATCGRAETLQDKPTATSPAEDDWLLVQGATNAMRKLAPSYYAPAASVSNVDNTSDADKPVSIAQSEAIGAVSIAVSGKANLIGGNIFTGPQVMPRVDYAQLVPAVQPLGTISGGGTATLLATATRYKATFSGSTATIALPASPPDGVYTLDGITTYNSGTQTITIPALIRPEYDFDSTITSFTNPAPSQEIIAVEFDFDAGSGATP